MVSSGPELRFGDSVARGSSVVAGSCPVPSLWIVSSVSPLVTGSSLEVLVVSVILVLYTMGLGYYMSLLAAGLHPILLCFTRNRCERSDLVPPGDPIECDNSQIQIHPAQILPGVRVRPWLLSTAD